MTESQQGWFLDPSSRHEARWFSDGTATALVRDGTVESQDPFPATAPRTAPGPIDPGAARSRGADPVRADDGDRAHWASGGSSATPAWRSGLWLALFVLGLVLLVFSFQPPDMTTPTRAMTTSEMAAATAAPISTRFDELPDCDGRFGLDPIPAVTLGSSDAGRVVTLYQGQFIEIDFDDGESTSPVGKTLCDGGDSGGEATGPDDGDLESGEYSYGVMGTGVDFVALPQSGGGDSVFELSIVPVPAPAGLTTTQIVLRVTGPVLMVAGMFLFARGWRRRRATGHRPGVALS